MTNKQPRLPDPAEIRAKLLAARIPLHAYTESLVTAGFPNLRTLIQDREYIKAQAEDEDKGRVSLHSYVVHQSDGPTIATAVGLMAKELVLSGYEVQYTSIHPIIMDAIRDVNGGVRNETSFIFRPIDRDFIAIPDLDEAVLAMGASYVVTAMGLIFDKLMEYAENGCGLILGRSADQLPYGGDFEAFISRQALKLPIGKARETAPIPEPRSKGISRARRSRS